MEQFDNINDETVRKILLYHSLSLYLSHSLSFCLFSLYLSLLSVSLSLAHSFAHSVSLKRFVDIKMYIANAVRKMKGRETNNVVLLKNSKNHHRPYRLQLNPMVILENRPIACGGKKPPKKFFCILNQGRTALELHCGFSDCINAQMLPHAP
jgi:hypothetical protein